MTNVQEGSDAVIVGSVLALCVQTPGARRRSGQTSWRNGLRQLKRSGFDRVDLLDNWLPFADITESEVDDFGNILADLGLTATGLGTSRRSLIDPQLSTENLDYTLRIVEVASRLGLRHVGLGFHPALIEAQKKSTAFWEHPGPPDDRTSENWDRATERLSIVCDFAAARGVDVNIELYEDSLFCTAADATRLTEAVDRKNFGINPDLGNIIRAATPLREPWLVTFRGCVDHMTYWHLKNYTRSTPSQGGPFAVAATALGDGTIDYRLAVTEALRAGYAGPFVIEHYGGDALWMQERGRRYLERLLEDLRQDSEEDRE